MSINKTINTFIFSILPGLLLIIFTFWFWKIYHINKIKSRLRENYSDSIYNIKYCKGEFDDCFSPVYTKEEYKTIRIKECQQLKVIHN